MCVDHDAKLPALPAGRGDAVGEHVKLTARDGAVFNAYAARSSEPDGRAVVVLPDVRGLFPFYEELAFRFAEEGIDSVAMDYFGRTAGTAERGPDFPYMDHVPLVDSAGFSADVSAAVSHLRAVDADTRFYAVGFCFGGNMAWAAATRHSDLRLAGAVAFYGKPEADRPVGDGPILERCHLIHARVLSIFGGDDPGIPAENVEALNSAMSRAGIDHESVTYPGAPHSFFDRSQADHTDAARDAWSRMMEFMT